METPSIEATNGEQCVEDILRDCSTLPFPDLDPDEESSIFVKPQIERHANSILGWVMRQLRRTGRPSLVSQECKSFHLTNFFEEMPYDIVSMILQYLHPVDLYHLTKTSRALRTLLTTRHSRAIWASAYDQEPNVPRCPPSVSPTRWAHLLFGPLRCENCHNSVEMTDFGLGQRLCCTCSADTTTQPTTWDGETGEGILWTMIPFASFYRGNGDDVPMSDEYLKSDVMRVSQEIARLKTAVEAGKEGAKTRYEGYVKLAKQKAQGRDEWNTACSKAFAEIFLAIDREHDDRLYKFDDQLKKRFMGIGYTGEDYDDGRFSFELYELEIERYPRVSNKVWNRVRPRVEHHMVQAMKERLERERQNLLERRRNMINDVYGKFREKCPPSTWAYHPPGYTIQNQEPFLSFIEDPSDRMITAEDCAAGVAILPEFIDRWTTEKITQLASLLPGQGSQEGPSCGSPAAPSMQQSLRKLELATSVFHCMGSKRNLTLNGRCLIGWDGAGAHLRCGALKSHFDNRLHFNDRGYDAAVAVIASAGRDPKTTLAREMDADGYRFVCANCDPSADRTACTWRSAILHHIDSPLEPNGHAEDTPPAFTLLTPEAAADVKRQEDWDPLTPPPRDIAWCCNLCPAHWDESVTKTAAISHVQNTHGIQRPVENIDYIYFASSLRSKPKPVLLRPSADATHMCLRCHHNPKLWSWAPLMAHLRGKHATSRPNENKDWIKVELFMSTTPPRQEQPAHTQVNSNESTESNTTTIVASIS